MKKSLTLLLALANILIWDISVAQSDQRQVIKIMTYNILHGAAPGLKNTADKVDLEEVAKVIRTQDPDIVALQEVDSMWSRSNRTFQPKVLAEKTGLKYYYYSDSKSFTDTGGWGYGIAILSKYEMKDQHSLFLPYYYHSGSENWVNSIATIKFPNGREVKFICAHFDYLYEDNRILEAMFTSDIARRSEIPVILAGDLNSRPNSTPVKILNEEFEQTCRDCDLTFSSDRPRIKIDYIMYSKGSHFTFESESVILNDQTKSASDHLPYVVELRWK